jgi:hypothetical protein
MFLLTGDDLHKTILGCSDGPASFNAELTKIGGKVISADPVYRFSTEEIRSRVVEVCPLIVSEVSKNRNDYVWEQIRDTDHLVQKRMDAMEIFLTDYEQGKSYGRYVEASLPDLPFETGAFDLALCSHFLFLYSSHVSLEVHLNSMKELCRVAKEVRIYPVVTLEGKCSEHIGPVVSELENDGLDVSLQKVRYRFQKGADKMLVAKRQEMNSIDGTS